MERFRWEFGDNKKSILIYDMNKGCGHELGGKSPHIASLQCTKMAQQLVDALNAWERAR